MRDQITRLDLERALDEAEPAVKPHEVIAYCDIHMAEHKGQRIVVTHTDHGVEIEMSK